MNTRNAMICLGCVGKVPYDGIGGKDPSLETRCQPCWNVVKSSLEERIKELESKEEENELFKECCECDVLKEKVKGLEKKSASEMSEKKFEEKARKDEERIEGLENSQKEFDIMKARIRRYEEVEGKESSNRNYDVEMSKLDERIENYEKELALNAEKVADIDELKVVNIRLKTTVEEYERKLVVKMELLEQFRNSLEKIQGENKALRVQMNEYEKGRKCQKEDKQVSDEKEGWSVVQNRRKVKSFAEVARPGQNGRQDTGKKDENQQRTGRRRDKIGVVGDSMVRNIEKVVGMNEEGSCKKSIGGAGIYRVMREAVEVAKETPGNSKIFIVGGGNSLKQLGPEKTVQTIIEGAREIKKWNSKAIVTVFGLLPRPRENNWYERARCRTNEMLMEEISKLYAEEGVNIICKSLDDRMEVDCFGRDGVHLNWKGNGVLGGSIVEMLRFIHHVEKNMMESN